MTRQMDDGGRLPRTSGFPQQSGSVREMRLAEAHRGLERSGPNGTLVNTVRLIKTTAFVPQELS